MLISASSQTLFPRDCLVKGKRQIKAAHSSLKGNELCSAIMLLTDEIFCSLHVHHRAAAGISKIQGGGWQKRIHADVQEDHCPL